MKEHRFSGEEMAYIVAEAESVETYQSVKIFVHGQEVSQNDVEMIFYDDGSDDDSEE